MSEKQSNLSIGRGGKRQGAGRPKGSVDKGNATIREMIAQTLTNLGGVDYLTDCATDPKTKGAFLALIGKTMPLQLTGDSENPVALNLSVTFHDVN